MVCPKCKTLGVPVTIFNITEYYCRTCKDDIKLESDPFPQEFECNPHNHIRILQEEYNKHMNHMLKHAPPLYFHPLCQHDTTQAINSLIGGRNKTGKLVTHCIYCSAEIP